MFSAMILIRFAIDNNTELVVMEPPVGRFPVSVQQRQILFVLIGYPNLPASKFQVCVSVKINCLRLADFFRHFPPVSVLMTVDDSNVEQRRSRTEQPGIPTAQFDDSRLSNAPSFACE